MVNIGPMFLVYRDENGNLYFQSWVEVQESGTLIDPETGEDLDLVGWSETGEVSSVS